MAPENAVSPVGMLKSVPDERHERHHADKADDHAGDRRQKLDARFENVLEALGSDFGDEERGHDAERDGDERGEHGDKERAEDEGENAELRRVRGGIPERRLKENPRGNRK